jgi:hypothetical protein
MACSEVPIQTILGTECIGDSLPKIMGNFNTLGDATCDLITDVAALSSYTGNLLSLLQSVSAALTTTTNTLSTNMQNIGNYPYAKFSESNTDTPYDVQLSTGDGTFPRILNTVESDYSAASLNTSTGIITLPAGTYRIIIDSNGWRYENSTGGLNMDIILRDSVTNSTIYMTGPAGRDFSSNIVFNSPVTLQLCNRVNGANDSNNRTYMTGGTGTLSSLFRIEIWKLA